MTGFVLTAGILCVIAVLALALSQGGRRVRKRRGGGDGGSVFDGGGCD